MRFMRYAVVGGIAFAIDFGLLLVLVGTMPLLAANTIAFLVANAANFALAHGWVFGRGFRDGSLGRQYVAVLGVSLVGLVLNDAVVWGGVEVAHLGVVAAKLAATAVALAWNYAARARWVYA